MFPYPSHFDVVTPRVSTWGKSGQDSAHTTPETGSTEFFFKAFRGRGEGKNKQKPGRLSCNEYWDLTQVLPGPGVSLQGPHLFRVAGPAGRPDRKVNTILGRVAHVSPWRCLKCWDSGSGIQCWVPGWVHGSVSETGEPHHTGEDGGAESGGATLPWEP